MIKKHTIALAVILVFTPILASGSGDSTADLFKKAEGFIAQARSLKAGKQDRDACARYEEAQELLLRISSINPAWRADDVGAAKRECAAAIEEHWKGRPNILFCGAQGTIFGSCYLLDTGTKKIVLDCGLFSEPEWIEKNDSFPFEPEEVDACIISHAHVDHVAKVPLLYRYGFHGRTYCSEPSREIAFTLFDLVLRGLSDEHISPYQLAHVKMTKSLMKAVSMGKWHSLGGGVRMRLLHSGHILGAAMIEVAFTWKKKEYSLLFSGDTRNPHSPLTPKWTQVKEADWVIIESVYGNRRHGDFDKEFERFVTLVNETLMRGGTVVIPAYSVARTQKILYYLYTLWKGRKFRRLVDIYVDSSMANSITDIHVKYQRYLAPPVRRLFQRSINPFDFPNFHRGGPKKDRRVSKIVIAPSGMCDVGRIRHYVKMNVADKDSTIIFTGFVLPESLGGQILARKRYVRIDGVTYPVRCKSYKVSAFSGHADQDEITRWFSGFKRAGVVFVTHGLPDGQAHLAARLRDELGLKSYVPRYLERVDLMEILDERRERKSEKTE